MAERESGLDVPLTSLSEDYALISRVVDPTTGQLVVTAAGIMAYGTRAAGEFLTDPAYMEQAAEARAGRLEPQKYSNCRIDENRGRKQRAAASGSGVRVVRSAARQRLADYFHCSFVTHRVMR